MSIAKLGDIIEIQTRRGLFYAQYTHKHRIDGELIQVSRRPFLFRPDNLNEVIQTDVGIITFFPLSAALRRRIFPRIRNLPIPPQRHSFPIFRIRGHIDRSGRVTQWKFWDGENTWPQHWLSELTAEQLELPIATGYNDTLLIERLESGPTPREHAKNH